MTTTVEYEVVIGLEVHAQLLTQSKMFCGCSTDYLNAEPNSHICPVCLGLPGSLPVINRRAIEYTLRTALALHCEIPVFTKFDRKNYFYPDLPKGYQISQYDLPLSRNGWMELESGGERRRVGITRVHLEEDTGKLVHAGQLATAQSSLVDFNRAGVPLMEIVGEPDLRSAEEAREYLMRLRALLVYIGVNDGNMEAGSLRGDANVSLRPKGVETFGTKVEIKNMNSFRSVLRAVEFEVGRQRQELERGGTLVQETRGWNDDEGVTFSQRSKEYAHDYRYFPEPDLPPLQPERVWLDTIRADLPELPAARRDRFMSAYGLSAYDAEGLTQTRAWADYYERVVAAGAPAKLAANWLLDALAARLNAEKHDIAQARISSEHLAELIRLVTEGRISGKIAKEVFEEAYTRGESPAALVEAGGLAQISGADELRTAVQQAILENPKAVADYQAGKERALAALVGAVMKATKGRANPTVVNALLQEQLG
jgi:aspartyl-tRNA(Asn)/glutamyl-tRNA(Gln) amidotransferase subunit B